MTLAQTLNFTRTADQVFLTQQAVSRSISAVEKELGFKLFSRSTRSVKLTKEGEALYVLLDRQMKEYQSAVAHLRMQQHPHNLRVGYQNFLTFHEELKQAMAELQQLEPKTMLEGNRYCPPVLRKQLECHELDMVVIYERFFPEQSGYICQPLCQIPQYLMVSPEFSVPPDDPLPTLLQAPFLIDRFEYESQREFEARIAMERSLFRFTGETIIVPDRDSAYTYAELGRGVVVGTTCSIMSSGRALVQYESGIRELLAAVWHEGDANPLPAQYSQLLREAFRSAWT